MDEEFQFLLARKCQCRANRIVLSVAPTGVCELCRGAGVITVAVTLLDAAKLIQQAVISEQERKKKEALG